MQVGDLVKAKNDPRNLCGFGILYAKDGRHLGRVYWFDEVLNDSQDKWVQICHLELVNAPQKDT